MPAINLTPRPTNGHINTTVPPFAGSEVEELISTRPPLMIRYGLALLISAVAIVTVLLCYIRIPEVVFKAARVVARPTPAELRSSRDIVISAVLAVEGTDVKAGAPLLLTDMALAEGDAVRLNQAVAGVLRDAAINPKKALTSWTHSEPLLGLQFPSMLGTSDTINWVGQLRRWQAAHVQTAPISGRLHFAQPWQTGAVVPKAERWAWVKPMGARVEVDWFVDIEQLQKLELGQQLLIRWHPPMGKAINDKGVVMFKAALPEKEGYRVTLTAHPSKLESWHQHRAGGYEVEVAAGKESYRLIDRLL